MKRLSLTIFLFSVCLLGTGAPSLAWARCHRHEDCVLKSCCPAQICVDRRDMYRPCPHPGLACDFAHWPEDQVCGCFNGACQGSQGLYENYKSTELEAVWLSRDQLKLESLDRCDQLHGKYIFECYRKIAQQLFPVSRDDAIGVCEALARKYYNNVKDDYSLYEECFTSLALKLAEDNIQLAQELCDKAWRRPIYPRRIDYRTHCLQEVGRIYARDHLQETLKMCERHKDYEKEFCYQAMAVQLKNSSLCEQLQGRTDGVEDLTPDDCYARMAVEWKDPSFCALVADDNERKVCLWTVRHGPVSSAKPPTSASKILR